MARRLALIATVIGLVTSIPASAGDYTFSLLDTLGGRHSFATAINNNGMVVGSAYVAGGGGPHATLWSDGLATDLGTLGGADSRAYDINASGQIVGTARTTQGVMQATLWNQGTVTNLGNVAGGTNSSAKAINDSGQILGNTFLANGAFHDLLWDSGGVHDIGTWSSTGNALAINNAGTIVGEGRFFRQDNLNEKGQIVGTAYYSASGAYHATLWAGSTQTDLGTLGGMSRAVGINELGQIVGMSNTTTTRHAVLWEHGAMIDLDTYIDASSFAAGWRLDWAWDINDNGWIVGDAKNIITGDYRGFLLSKSVEVITPPPQVTPIPEPETYAMLLAGLGLLGGIARRRKQQQASA